MFGETFRSNATVPNDSIITNLPDKCAVEVTVVADKSCFQAIHVGDLPPQFARPAGPSPPPPESLSGHSSRRGGNLS